MGSFAHIQIEGYRELARGLRQAQDKDLPKALGRAHKTVGGEIIARLEPPPAPQAVGAGGGASVRPSATVRELVLRAGGAHRVDRATDRGVPARRVQWGKKEVQPFVPGRPNIVGTALAMESEIRERLLQEIVKELGPHFASAL